MTRFLTIALFLLGCGPSWATTVTLELPGDEKPESRTVAYACGERTVTATYINTSDNQFAILKLDGATVVMVSVLSGTGAKYAGQQYEWWTKGSGATLTDLRNSSEPTTCAES